MAEHRLCLNGNTGDYVWSPNHIDFLDPEGYDVRVAIAPDQWQRPFATAVFDTSVLGLYAGNGTGRFIVSLRPLNPGVGISGAINNRVSNNGGVGGGVNSTLSDAAPPGVDGSPLNIRVAYHNVVSPAHFDLTFYWKPFVYVSALADLVDDNGWTQLGSAFHVNASIPPFQGSNAFRIGDADLGAPFAIPFIGKVYAMAYYSDVGGSLVACPDFTQQPYGTTDFIDACGKEWFFNGTAAICVDVPAMGVGGFLRQKQRSTEQDGRRASFRNRIQ